MTATTTDEKPIETQELLDWLEIEVSAIDTWYRGSPSYERDAGWMKDEVFRLLKHARQAFSTSQP